MGLPLNRPPTNGRLSTLPCNGGGTFAALEHFAVEPDNADFILRFLESAKFVASTQLNWKTLRSRNSRQSVTLMARTDVVEDGYPWFKIAYEGDGKGYQWGGILCSAGDERPDLYKTCPTAPTKHESETSTKRKTETRAAAKRCASGRVLIDGKCIQRGAAAGYCGPPLSTEQRKAVNRGCPKGQVWNAQEGCHEDD